MKIIKIIDGTSVDGPGLRTSIYFSGCSHHCPGCQNPQTWDINAGNDTDIDDVLKTVIDNDFDVTFSGGDPLFQVEEATELAKRIKARVLQASTSEVYGDPTVHPQVESYWGNVNPIGVRSCYDEGKRCAETLFFDYHRQSGVDIRVIRIFNTYGPNMLENDGRVVSNFIVQALSNKDITIYGDGSQTRSFCYVADLVTAMIKMMDCEDFTGPVNLGNPRELTIKEIAEMIIALTGSKSKLVYKPLPKDDPTRRKPNITLAKEKLGWEPQVMLEDGLKSTIEYFKNRM